MSSRIFHNSTLSYIIKHQSINAIMHKSGSISLKISASAKETTFITKLLNLYTPNRTGISTAIIPKSIDTFRIKIHKRNISIFLL